MKTRYRICLLLLLVVCDVGCEKYEFDVVKKHGKNFMVVDVPTPKKVKRKAKAKKRKAALLKKKQEAARKMKLENERKAVELKKSVEASKKAQVTPVKSVKAPNSLANLPEAKRKLFLEDAWNKIKELAQGPAGKGAVYGGGAGAGVGLGRRVGLMSKKQKFLMLLDQYSILLRSAQMIDKSCYQVYYSLKLAYTKLDSIAEGVPLNLMRKEDAIKELLDSTVIGDVLYR